MDVTNYGMKEVLTSGSYLPHWTAILQCWPALHLFVSLCAHITPRPFFFVPLCCSGGLASCHILPVPLQGGSGAGRRLREAYPGGVLVCPLGVPSVLVGATHTQPSQAAWAALVLKSWSIFLCVCGYVEDWPHGVQVRFWRPKGPHSDKEQAVWQSPSSWDKRLWTFQKILVFYFYGSKVVLWVKKWCFWVFWTKFEVADLKQRQGVTPMDHRNKFQSSVLPTHNSGDAPNCMFEYGSYTASMAAHTINWPIFQNKGFPGTTVGFCADGPSSPLRTSEHPQDTTSVPPASCCRLPIRPVYLVGSSLCVHWISG